jgi:energy-coupling factor transporter ATP-binding protein EcfA2
MKYISLFTALIVFITIPTFFIFLIEETQGNALNLSFDLIRESIREAAFISIIISCGLSAVLAPFITYKERYKHVSGPNILSGRSGIRHAKKQLNINDKLKALWIHPKIAISALEELGNLLCIGMQGSGKSTIIKFWLNQLMKRSATILIYDEKREYTEIFLTDNVKLLSPGDARSVRWDLSRDITDISSARTFADAVINQTSQEPFWSDAARLIVTGALMCLINSRKTWGWTELHAILFKEPNNLQKELQQHYSEAALFADPENRTSASVLGVISSQLSWIKYVADVQNSNSETFSFFDWLSADVPIKLIVQTNPSYRSMSESLFSVALSMLTNHVLTLSDSSKREIWLVLDELAAIPKNDTLKRWLATGRSRGARTIGGIQSISQIQETYGDKNAETILGLFATVIALRVGLAGQAASVTSDAMGKRRVFTTSTSTDSDGNKSFTESEQELDVVYASQLVHLPRPDKHGVVGYLTFAGANAAYRLKWPYPKVSKITEGFDSIHFPEDIKNTSLDTSARKSKNPFIQEK